MAIYTKIHASDLNKIVASYQIEVIDFTPIEGGNANSNYHIYAKSGEYMMTIVEEKSLQEAQKLTTLLQWLGKHHFLTSPVQATITGEMVTQYAGRSESTRLNSSHKPISYAVFCLKKKNKKHTKKKKKNMNSNQTQRAS